MSGRFVKVTIYKNVKPALSEDLLYLKLEYISVGLCPLHLHAELGVLNLQIVYIYIYMQSIYTCNIRLSVSVKTEHPQNCVHGS